MKIAKACHLLTQEIGVYHIKEKTSLSHLNINYHALKISMDQTVTSTANHVMTISDPIIAINLVHVYVIMDGLETTAKFVSDEIYDIYNCT